MFCRECGQKNLDKANFCSKCGVSLKETPARELDKEKISKISRINLAIAFSKMALGVCIAVGVIQFIAILGGLLFGKSSVPWAWYYWFGAAIILGLFSFFAIKEQKKKLKEI